MASKVLIRWVCTHCYRVNLVANPSVVEGLNCTKCGRHGFPKVPEEPRDAANQESPAAPRADALPPKRPTGTTPTD